jgi:type IV pilus assembly protein PilM
MKKNLSFRSLRYSGDILGVDLGTHTVKLMQLRVSGKRVAVLHYAQRLVWPQLAQAKTEDERKEVFTRALREMLGVHSFDAKRAAFALSGSFALVRFVALPEDFKKDSRFPIPEEVRTLSPFEPDDTEIDLRWLQEPPAKQPELMAMIAQRKAIDDLSDIVEGAGLRPAVVINDALALENAYDFMRAGQPQETAVMVGIGAATTSVSLIQGGALRSVRTLNIAGDLFTRAIKRDFGGTVEEAEDLKKEYGLAGYTTFGEGGAEPKDTAAKIYKETAARIYKLLKAPVHDLGVGIQRTIDAYMDKHPGSPAVTRVLLAGGGAEMKRLSEALCEQLALPVERFRPLAKAHLGGARAEIEKAPSACAVAFGLALSSTLRRESVKRRLNVLPARAKRAAAFRNNLRSFGAVALAAALAVAGARGYSSHRASVAEREAEAERMLKAIPHKKSSKPHAAPKVVQKEMPFAYLGRMRVSGAYGDVVMLAQGGKEYVAKGGRLFNESGDEVSGVTSRIGAETLTLTTNTGEKYVINVPK